MVSSSKALLRRSTALARARQYISLNVATKTPATNVFCPTGEGGGIKPTCKKVHKISSVLSLYRSSLEYPYILSHRLKGSLIQISVQYDGNPRSLHISDIREVPGASSQIGKLGPSKVMKILRAIKSDHPGVTEVTGTRAWDRKRGGQKTKLQINVFCPTGPGGGSDPTCSPGGKSRGLVLSKGRKKKSGDYALDDDIPVEPGTSPIPKNHIRFFHYSNVHHTEGTLETQVHDRAVSLRTKGIQMSSAKGEVTQEPNQIWASSKMPDNISNKIFVEFSLAVDDPRIGGTYKRLTGSADEIKERMKVQRDATFVGDISPRDIIAVHEPWHFQTRYLLEHPPSIEKAKAGGFDSLLKTKEDSLNEYAASIRRVKDTDPSTLTSNAKKKSINPLSIDPTRTTTIQRTFEEQISKRYTKFQRELIKLLVSDDALGLKQLTANTFCPTGPGGGIDPTCSPSGKKVDPTRTKAFKEWFAGSKVVRRKDGKPLKVYHGTIAPTDFHQFKAAASGSFGTLDQKIGVHFAEDLKSAQSFALKYDGRVGRMYPVYLSVKNPLVIKQRRMENGSLEGDAVAINREIRNATFPNNKPLFVSWITKARMVTEEQGGEIFDRLSKGESIGDHEYNRVAGHNLNSPRRTKSEHPVSSYVGDYDSSLQMLDNSQKDTVLRDFHTSMRRQGYDGIRYTNTAPMETIGVKNRTAWIVFNPSQIKSAIGNKGTYDPNDPLITNAFKFHSTQAKIDNFERWIISKLTETMEDKDIHSGLDWWQLYIERAFKQGSNQAYIDVKGKGPAKDQRAADQATGAKNQAMSMIYGMEATKERLKLLSARTFKGMKGLNDMMKSQLTLALIDGMLQGQSPRAIAKVLTEKIGINKSRALMIARTEVVRSFNEGTLAVYKGLGVKKIGVKVEILVSGNACPKCRKLKGKVFTIEKAQGLLPVHPSCKCAFAPYVEPTVNAWKERQRKRIERSILSVTRPQLTDNVKKGWTKEARIKSALVRKAKKKVEQRKTEASESKTPAVTQRELNRELESSRVSKQTLAAVETWGKSLKWKGKLPKLDGKFDKEGMKVLNEVKDKILRDLGYTAKSRPAGYCHVASVMMWDMLGRPSKLFPTVFNALNAPNGDTHFGLYFYSPGWKNPWVVDPTGAQYGYKVFTDKSVIDKMGYSNYKKVAAYYAPVKLSPDKIANLRLEAYLAVNRVRDPAGPNRLRVSSENKKGSFNLTFNVFCPTGKGGGVDPSCGKSKKKSNVPKKKSKVVWFNSDDDDMDYDLANEALQVAKRSGINILSDKELVAATVDKDGNVTGALYTGLSNDEYSFDVAVDPKHQGKGIGSQLTDLGIDNFGNYAEMGATMKLDAVNPIMVEALKRRGFEITGSHGGHTFMEPTANVFCPTGEGGGVDPTCSPASLSSVSRVGEFKSVGLGWLVDDKGTKEKSFVSAVNRMLKWNETSGKEAGTKLAAICGAPKGASVRVELSKNMMNEYSGIRVNYKSKEVESADRHISLRDGNYIMNNYSIKIHKSSQRAGEGTKILAQQVDLCHKNGIKLIEAVAARTRQHNGYYSWARLGFDSALTKIEFRPAIQKNLLKTFPEAVKVSDLMRTAEGREWWKKNGVTFTGEFDTRPGSLSRKVLEAYVAAKFQK